MIVGCVYTKFRLLVDFAITVFGVTVSGVTGFGVIGFGVTGLDACTTTICFRTKLPSSSPFVFTKILL